MAQLNQRDATPATPEAKRPPMAEDDPAAQDETHFPYFLRYRRISPEYARARNHSWALLGGIVLAAIVMFAVAAWVWQALGTAA